MLKAGDVCRPVFQDADGRQWVVGYDGEPVNGVWLLPADEPHVVEADVKRKRLPKPSDRQVDFLDAWAEEDGRLGIEFNDKGSELAILLHVSQKELDTIAKAVKELRDKQSTK